jgi:hypothetical protein
MPPKLKQKQKQKQKQQQKVVVNIGTNVIKKRTRRTVRKTSGLPPPSYQQNLTPMIIQPSQQTQQIDYSPLIMSLFASREPSRNTPLSASLNNMNTMQTTQTAEQMAGQAAMNRAETVETQPPQPPQPQQQQERRAGKTSEDFQERPSFQFQPRPPAELTEKQKEEAAKFRLDRAARDAEKKAKAESEASQPSTSKPGAGLMDELQQKIKAMAEAKAKAQAEAFQQLPSAGVSTVSQPSSSALQLEPQLGIPIRGGDPYYMQQMITEKKDESGRPAEDIPQAEANPVVIRAEGEKISKQLGRPPASEITKLQKEIDGLYEKLNNYEKDERERISMGLKRIPGAKPKYREQIKKKEAELEELKAINKITAKLNRK